jgi:DNA-binding transcriptional LysR family regulator
MLARFMARYPGINLQLEATNRRVDLVSEGIDVAIRVRPRPFDDSDLVLRVLADRGHCLVAGPQLIQRQGMPEMPSELSAWPGLSMGEGKQVHKWELTGQRAQERKSIMCLASLPPTCWRCGRRRWRAWG